MCVNNLTRRDFPIMALLRKIFWHFCWQTVYSFWISHIRLCQYIVNCQLGWNSGLNMSLQIFWCSDKFSTRITIVSLFFMNCLDLKISWYSEGFSARITFVIFMSLMKSLDVLLKISLCRKVFSTRITFVIYLSFM